MFIVGWNLGSRRGSDAQSTRKVFKVRGSAIHLDLVVLAWY